MQVIFKIKRCGIKSSLSSRRSQVFKTWLRLKCLIKSPLCTQFVIANSDANEIKPVEVEARLLSHPTRQRHNATLRSTQNGGHRLAEVSSTRRPWTPDLRHPRLRPLPRCHARPRTGRWCTASSSFVRSDLSDRIQWSHPDRYDVDLLHMNQTYFTNLSKSNHTIVFMIHSSFWRLSRLKIGSVNEAQLFLLYCF